MLLAAQIGWNAPSSVGRQHEAIGNDVRDVSGEFTTVKASDDPIFKQFPYDPDQVLRIN
jgi:hypothetical protein